MFRFANWTTLRTIGNSWAVKATLLLPLIGYFIIFNENVVRYLNLAAEFTTGKETNLTVQPRLLQVYFALCFVSVASVIYTLVCPVIIKRYDSSTTYVREEFEHLGDYHVGEIEDQLRENPAYEPTYRRIRERYDTSSRLGVTQEDIEANKRKVDLAVLHLFYDLQNASHPWARLVALVCYVVGFVLLLIPSVQVFFRVTALLWAELFS